MTHARQGRSGRGGVGGARGTAAVQGRVPHSATLRPSLRGSRLLRAAPAGRSTRRPAPPRCPHLPGAHTSPGPAPRLGQQGRQSSRKRRKPGAFLSRGDQMQPDARELNKLDQNHRTGTTAPAMHAGPTAMGAAAPLPMLPRDSLGPRARRNETSTKLHCKISCL